MKIFIDTANIDQIKEVNSWGILDGVTTNPTLISKEGKDFNTIADEILNEVNGPVTFETNSYDVEGIVKEARELAALSKNVVVKIPIFKNGLIATKILSSENISIDTTLIFSANQALLSTKAGARYISPFLGRLDDIGFNGVEVLKEILDIVRNYQFTVEVIAASVRNPIHFLTAAQLGCHIATVPYNVISSLIEHPLTNIGIEKFKKDWAKMKK